MPIESTTPATIEAWLAGVDRASSTRVKALVLLHGNFQPARNVWSLPANPVADVEKPPLRASADIRGLLAQGAPGARPRDRLRTGRDLVPDGGLHGLPDRRAARAAVA